MTTQTTPLQHADNFFVKPDFCGYGFVSGSGTHRERQQTKTSYNKPKDARPQSTLRASLARGFTICLHIKAMADKLQFVAGTRQAKACRTSN
jgi:hypothetical protein